MSRKDGSDVHLSDPHVTDSSEPTMYFEETRQFVRSSKVQELYRKHDNLLAVFASHDEKDGKRQPNYAIQLIVSHDNGKEFTPEELDGLPFTIHIGGEIERLLSPQSIFSFVCHPSI